MNRDEVMFTHSRLAELAGVSAKRLSYWEESGLIRARTTGAMRGKRVVRLYGYSDAFTVLILAALRERVSLQHIRQIVRHLRERDFQVPEVRFAVVGPRVFFQTPDGEWEDVRDPMQIVISETLDLRPLRARLDRSNERDEQQLGKVERRRGALGSQPLIAGTRVPVSAVERYLARGASVERILTAYPGLTAEDVTSVKRSVSA